MTDLTPTQERARQILAVFCGVFIGACVVVAIYVARAGGASW